ncbi:MAG: VanZ family protein [Bacteroidota bacterium]
MTRKKTTLTPFIGSIIVTLVILYGSFSPDTGGVGILSRLGLDFKNSDKLLHLFFYFLLSISLYWGFIRQKYSFSKSIIHSYSLIIPFLMGGLVEIIQGKYIQSRHGEVEDMAANTLGILIAFLLYQIYNRHFKR